MLLSTVTESMVTERMVLRTDSSLVLMNMKYLELEADAKEFGCLFT